ncbi:MAG TPA: rhodanese-like domain-containing protein [Thermoanaerobaculia bacterium]|nr:rhodanese-like domain-containing protein [Thermoanaerobaculia bacterium]
MIARLMGLETISPRALQQVLPDVTVYDVNSRGSWMQAHVPGALPLDPLNFDAAQLPADKSAPLVFYCSNLFCRKAPNAARRAAGMGYTNVRVMSAGISGWLSAGLPADTCAAEAALH